MLEIWFSLGITAFAVWISWRWKRTSTFSNLGIPGPRPNLIFGNILELYKKGPVRCHEEWVKKYGKIVGYYYGMKPVLLVADSQLLKNIFIKDFSKFTDREPFNPLMRPEHLDQNSQSVLILRGQKWKEIRSVLTPSFSTAKMKQMSSMINSSVETMVNKLKKEAEEKEVVDVIDTYQRLTMDVIAKTAFGILLDVQTSKEPRLLRIAQLLFQTPFTDPFVFLGLVFPGLRKLAVKLQMLVLRILNKGSSPTNELQRDLLRVLNYRKSHPEVKKPDLLQMMIDTKISLESGQDDLKDLEAGKENDDKEFDGSRQGTASKVRNMTEKEIVASAFTVFLAGYETTSTSLSFTSYLLAKHPDIQEKVHKEITGLLKKEGKLTYETVHKLPYLDRVFNESLRIYPPVYLFTTRYANEDVEYGPLKIPKGMVVQAPVYLLHHDPDYWSDPFVFDPERFATKPNMDGITFMPFGVGPRNCMGMRFAQMEAKLALAHLVYNFRISLPKSESNDLKTTLRIRTISPKYKVEVKLENRA